MSLLSDKEGIQLDTQGALCKSGKADEIHA